MVKTMPGTPRAARGTVTTDVVTRVSAHVISPRAYELFQELGSEHGHDIADSVLAEAELREGNGTGVVPPFVEIQRRLGWRSTPQAERDVSTSTILLPAAASLCPTVAGEHRHQVREELVRRIRGEFEEMPGLSLTSAQASKLFGISLDVCPSILSHLIEEGVLHLKSDGRYARSEGMSC
jgi:hypothetical protein